MKLKKEGEMEERKHMREVKIKGGGKRWRNCREKMEEGKERSRGKEKGSKEVRKVERQVKKEVEERRKRVRE